MRSIRSHAIVSAGSATIVAALFTLTGMKSTPGGLTPEQVEVLGHLRMVKIYDGNGSNQPTLQVHGVNLQVVNGSGISSTTNGRGNLIVGYNEKGLDTLQTGSHNVVLGTFNAHTEAGGMVAGNGNSISGRYAMVTGGQGNAAVGWATAVHGGEFNTASGSRSSILGGLFNEASGHASTVYGGKQCTSSHFESAVAGCQEASSSDCQVLP